jgi:hypothetical protein
MPVSQPNLPRPVLAASLLLGMVMAFSHGWALAGAGEDFDLHFEEGRLTLHAKSADLGALLEAVAAETHARVHLYSETSTLPVTLSLEAAPLHQALKRLLEGSNHVIVFSGEGDQRSVSDIYVLGVGVPVARTQGSRQAPAPAVTNDRQREHLPETFQDLIESADLPIGPEKLKELLSNPEVEAMVEKLLRGESLSKQESRKLRALSEELYRVLTSDAAR